MNFAITLDDKISPAAKTGAASLQALDAAIKRENATLGALEKQMRTLQRASVVDIGLHKQLSSAIGDQKNKVAGLTSDLLKAGGAGFSPVADKAANLESVLGPLAAKSGVAGNALKALGPYGIAAAAAIGAIVIAATAAAGAIVYLGSKLIELGVSASEAKGDITRSLELLYGSQVAADHTYRVLTAITGRIAISQDRVMELSNTLITAGQKNGDAMVASIEAIGKAEAARAGAGKVIEGVIVRAQKSRMFSVSKSELTQVGLTYADLAKEISKQTGMSIGEASLRLRTGGVALKSGLNALNQVVDSKMGDLANKKFMTVGAQVQRLRDGFTRLFDSFDTGPIARAIQVVANLFDESTVSGAAMRDLLKNAFDEISKAAEKVTPYIQILFKGAILLALKLYNALYPVRQAINNLFGGDQTKSVQSFEDTVLSFATGVGEGFKAAALAIAWMIDNAGKLTKVIEALITITPGIGIAFQTAKGIINTMTMDLGASKDKTKASGKSVADGVAEGIRAGTSNVEAAMAAMGDKGKDAFDKQMGIHSPSTVMRLRGMYLDQGLAKGVNDNASGPADAMGKVGDKTAAAASGGAIGNVNSVSNVSNRGGSPVTVTFAPGSIVLQGDASDVESLRSKLTELMADIFQQAALTQGAA